VVVPPPPPPLSAPLRLDTYTVLSWLSPDATRLVQMSGSWSCPVHGAGAERSRLDPLAAALGPVDPFDIAWHRGATPVRAAAG
jgi:DNA polymerase-3 subunit epsilon